MDPQLLWHVTRFSGCYRGVLRRPAGPRRSLLIPQLPEVPAANGSQLSAPRIALDCGDPALPKSKQPASNHWSIFWPLSQGETTQRSVSGISWGLCWDYTATYFLFLPNPDSFASSPLKYGSQEHPDKLLFSQISFSKSVSQGIWPTTRLGLRLFQRRWSTNLFEVLKAFHCFETENTLAYNFEVYINKLVTRCRMLWLQLKTYL